MSTAIDTIAGLSREELLDLYRQMLTIRRFEERSLENYTLGKIGGFLHLYIGEEAVAVGTISALEPRDHVITHYRDHGYAIARGVPPAYRRCRPRVKRDVRHTGPQTVGRTVCPTVRDFLVRRSALVETGC